MKEKLFRHRGACHCGRVRFEVDAPVDLDAPLEIGFLLMDWRLRGGAALGEPLLILYRHLINPSDLTALLPFDKGYRALIRGKVDALRAGASDAGA